MDPEPWSSLVVELVLLFAVLGVSAFLSAAETSLTSLSGARAQQMIEEERATWMNLWVKSPSMVITSILVGKSLANVLFVVLAILIAQELLTTAEFDTWGVYLLVASVAFALLTFAEVAPKTLGKRFYKGFASVSVRVLRGPFYLFYPLTWLYTELTQQLFRKLGGSHSTPGPLTFDEIEYMLDMNESEDNDHTRLLRSVVEFPDTLVREVMVPRTDIVSLSADMKSTQIIQTLVDCGHSRLPVYESSLDNILGIFYAKDLMRYHADNGTFEGFDPTAILRDPYFVPESKRIADLLGEFQRQRMHIAVVVDEFGGTSGIITLEDIVEEIFGDIQDEYDEEPAQITELGEQKLIADARVPIYEIEEYYDLDLPDHPDYETLAGFILAHAGSVPLTGQVFELHGLKFEIKDADAKKIIAVAIEPISESEFIEEAVG